MLLWAQSSGVLSVAPPERVAAKRGQTVTAKISADLRSGYHVNSNTPADEYLIPLKLSWTNSPLAVEQVIYPKPQLEKFDFSPQPVSIFSGTFDILTKFKVPANAASGLTTISGKLRYQACNNKECLAPKTIDIQLPVNVQ
ncbi:MAG: protein-disulfide reductase DsbD N-terminal domain-containing protein [Acidobacteriota bacterium]|nr:protein-disulfide reductase DsbD N-terminal domain-containing protein [Acidobacteriota bacterium]